MSPAYVLATRQTFGATPEEGSLLSAKMGIFFYANLTNISAINQATFEDIHDGILKAQGSSALWLFPAAVGIFI